MAVTGIGMLGFVLAHLVGNLKIYLGTEDDGRYAIDVYAEGLRTLLHPILPDNVVLWIFRAGLIVMVLAHIHAAATLTAMNRRANGTNYQSPRDYIAANFASRSMRYTGVIVAAYIALHIADLTLGRGGADFEHGAVHDNMIASLSRWPVAVLYMIANLAVALHLYHGAWSMFQSLGFNSPRYNSARRVFAASIAAIVAIGNLSFPILIATGVVS
jgi:succinate dehydrogenase / fumarate reductase cytochrome b subunit